MKLKYQFVAEGVNVILWQGEGWTDPDRKIIVEHLFPVEAVPDVLQARDAEYSVKSYGLAKLLQDRTSQVTGAEAKLEAMKDYFAIFAAGQWREYSEATGGGRKGRIDPLLVAAVAKLKKAPVAAVEKSLRALDAEERKALAALPAVQEHMDKLRAEADEAVDLSDMLS